MGVKSHKLFSEKEKQFHVSLAYLTILSILFFHDFGQFSEKFGHGPKRAWSAVKDQVLKKRFSDLFPYPTIHRLTHYPQQADALSSLVWVESLVICVGHTASAPEGRERQSPA